MRIEVSLDAAKKKTDGNKNRKTRENFVTNA